MSDCGSSSGSGRRRSRPPTPRPRPCLRWPSVPWRWPARRRRTRTPGWPTQNSWRATGISMRSNSAIRLPSRRPPCCRTTLRAPRPPHWRTAASHRSSRLRRGIRRATSGSQPRTGSRARTVEHLVSCPVSRSRAKASRWSVITMATGACSRRICAARRISDTARRNVRPSGRAPGGPSPEAIRYSSTNVSQAAWLGTCWSRPTGPRLRVARRGFATSWASASCRRGCTSSRIRTGRGCRNPVPSMPKVCRPTSGTSSRMAC